jgi:hypothetical protein
VVLRGPRGESEGYLIQHQNTYSLPIFRKIPIVPEKEYIKTHEISQNDWNLIKFQLTRCMQDEYQRLRAKASGATKPPPPRPANVIKIRRRGIAPDPNTSTTTPKRKGSPSYENEEYEEAYGVNPRSRDVSSPGPPPTPPLAGSLPPASPLTKRTGPLKYRPVYPDRSMYGIERIALRAQAAADFMSWRAENLTIDTPLK